MCGVDQVWCLSGGAEREHQINRTVDGAVLSILLTGLLPDTWYTVAVAAVTSLGVGAQSPPVSLLLSESPKLLQPLWRGAAFSALSTQALLIWLHEKAPSSTLMFQVRKH